MKQKGRFILAGVLVFTFMLTIFPLGMANAQKVIRLKTANFFPPPSKQSKLLEEFGKELDEHDATGPYQGTTHVPGNGDGRIGRERSGFKVGILYDVIDTGVTHHARRYAKVKRESALGRVRGHDRLSPGLRELRPTREVTAFKATVDRDAAASATTATTYWTQ